MIDLKALKEMMDLHPDGTHAVFVDDKIEGSWILTGKTVLSLLQALEVARAGLVDLEYNLECDENCQPCSYNRANISHTAKEAIAEIDKILKEE